MGSQRKNNSQKKSTASSPDDLVWSSDKGRSKPTKKKHPQSAPNDGVVRLQLDRKGRKGKGVTIITGLPLQGPDLKAFAKELKKKTGSGGTVKGIIIELQGDHRDMLLPLLQAKGWTAKKAGG